MAVEAASEKAEGLGNVPRQARRDHPQGVRSRFPQQRASTVGGDAAQSQCGGHAQLPVRLHGQVMAQAPYGGLLERLRHEPAGQGPAKSADRNLPCVHIRINHHLLEESERFLLHGIRHTVPVPTQERQRGARAHFRLAVLAERAQQRAEGRDIAEGHRGALAQSAPAQRLAEAADGLSERVLGDVREGRSQKRGGSSDTHILTVVLAHEPAELRRDRLVQTEFLQLIDGRGPDLPGVALERRMQVGHSPRLRCAGLANPSDVAQCADAGATRWSVFGAVRAHVDQRVHDPAVKPGRSADGHDVAQHLGGNYPQLPVLQGLGEAADGLRSHRRRARGDPAERSDGGVAHQLALVGDGGINQRVDSLCDARGRDRCRGLGICVALHH
mmetsp:Transcript_132968/g.384473  ORF Transcript_132968/g.384473 Transcript_132968/m.384473 type:complete len:386 (+) Transcript_132968:79-1236(+)